MPDATTIETMQLLSSDNQPDSDSEDSSASGTFGVRPMFQQIQSSLRGVSLTSEWTDLNGLTDTTWVGGLTPTFINATSFSYQGDQTNYFSLNRRLKATLNASTIYGYVFSATFSAGPNSTAVVAVWDSGALDATVSSVNIASLNPDHPSWPPVLQTQTNTGLSATVSGTNTYVGALVPSIASFPYSTKVLYIITFTNANTGASTLDLGAGPAPITKLGTQPLVSGDIQAGQKLTLGFDGTNFQVISLSGQGSGTLAAKGSFTLPGGLIIKWGSISVSSANSGSDTFATAFPNAAFVVIGSSSSGVTQQTPQFTVSTTAVSVLFGGIAETIVFNYFAIGN